MYAGFLTNKSRLIADTIVGESGEDFLVDCDRSQASKLYRHLRMFKLRAEVDIADLSESHRVVWTPNAKDPTAFDDLDPLLVAKDPRLERLGTRGIVSASSIPDDLEDVTMAYDHVRLSEGVGEGTDIEGRFPLEANVDWLNGVSFRKGCYIGQELTARTHFRGKVRKRCVPMEIVEYKHGEVTSSREDDSNEGSSSGVQSSCLEASSSSSTSSWKDAALYEGNTETTTSKAVGKIVSFSSSSSSSSSSSIVSSDEEEDKRKNNAVGTSWILAVLRLEHLERWEGEEKKFKVKANDGREFSTIARARKPDWWPSESDEQ